MLCPQVAAGNFSLQRYTSMAPRRGAMLSLDDDDDEQDTKGLYAAVQDISAAGRSSGHDTTSGEASCEDYLALCMGKRRHETDVHKHQSLSCICC